MPMIQNNEILEVQACSRPPDSYPGAKQSDDKPVTVGDKILKALSDPYFDHHTAMHLARERVELTNGHKAQLFLPMSACPSCKDHIRMKETGLEGSGVQFLQMHHEMIRVFRFLLDKEDLGLLAKWEGDRWVKKEDPEKRYRAYYEPELWDLDDFQKLPREIVGMLNVTDPDYLKLAFSGVNERTDPQTANLDNKDKITEAIDKLGMFIERGVDQRKNPGEPVNGSGIHNTMHDFLASREGKAAQGAEMNKLDKSRFNDYFWSLHLWIDGQYGRLLKRFGKDFNTTPLAPENTDMFTNARKHGRATGMSMA